MGAHSDTEVLVIERACERLVNEFFDAIDGRNEARLHELFTEDATYARPIDPNTVISGRDAIVQMFKARPTTKVMHHTCSNVLISVESAERVLVGRFEDVFVKTAAGWRFQSRRGRVLLHTA